MRRYYIIRFARKVSVINLNRLLPSEPRPSAPSGLLRSSPNSENTIPTLRPTQLIVSVSSFVGGGALLYMLPGGEMCNEDLSIS